MFFLLHVLVNHFYTVTYKILGFILMVYCRYTYRLCLYPYLITIIIMCNGYWAPQGWALWGPQQGDAWGKIPQLLPSTLPSNHLLMFVDKKAILNQLRFQQQPTCTYPKLKQQYVFRTILPVLPFTCGMYIML